MLRHDTARDRTTRTASRTIWLDLVMKLSVWTLPEATLIKLFLFSPLFDTLKPVQGNELATLLTKLEWFEFNFQFFVRIFRLLSKLLENLEILKARKAQKTAVNLALLSLLWKRCRIVMPIIRRNTVPATCWQHAFASSGCHSESASSDTPPPSSVIPFCRMARSVIDYRQLCKQVEKQAL